MKRLPYVLLFAVLMTGFAFARPAKGQDVIYVPPQELASRLEKHEAEIRSLRSSQESTDAKLEAIQKRIAGFEGSQTQINKEILDQFKQLRTELAAKNIPPPAVTVEQPQSQSVLTTTFTGRRSAVGHTHTDARGHTWDHQLDHGSHVCPVPGCGLTVTRIDPPGRMVNVAPVQSYIGQQPAAVQAAAYPPVQSYQAQPVQSFQYLTGAGYAVGGCSGAGCSSASTSRGGWYPGKLLGR